MTSGRAAKRRHADFGLVRRKRDNAACGLCGTAGALTKTHIPPQAAGNGGLVGRSRLGSQDGELIRSRSLHGGLYVYGLCAACNVLGSKYDAAYAELSDAVRSLWVRSWALSVPDRLAVPASEVAPGSVARSMLTGAFGLSPSLRTQFPGLAASLLAEEARILLPDALRLRLALCRGEAAHIAGATGGIFLFGKRVAGRAIGVSSVACVFFPPLAWHLAGAGSAATLLDEQGWADVSGWAMRDATDRQPLNELVEKLPAVAYPRQHPEQAEAYTELLSDKFTEIVECVQMPPSK